MLVGASLRYSQTSLERVQENIIQLFFFFSFREHCLFFNFNKNFFLVLENNVSFFIIIKKYMKYKNIKIFFFFKKFFSLNKVNFNFLNKKVSFITYDDSLCGNCTGLIHVKNI